MAKHHLGDGAIHPIIQFGIVGRAGSGRLDQFDLHAFGHNDTGIAMHRLERLKQPLLLLFGAGLRERSLCRRLSELVEEHQPKP